MKKRDRLEVIYDILKIVRDNSNSIRPTPLIRYSNLSSQSFAEYFAELKDKGLLKEVVDKDGKKYVTLTDLGFQYIDRYKTIRGFIDEFNL